MEIGQILHDLTHRTTLPVAALRAAAERRDEVVPVFLDILRRYIEGDREARQEPSPLSLIFHLLGQFREKSAYPLMTRLLRIDSEDLENLLGDAVTETVHRVIANVFDGNLQPIYDVIEDPDANVYVRSRMLETLALLVHTGAADKAEVERYLREIDQRLPPPDDDFVWIGWQSAIALLGLTSLAGLVEEAFRRDLIDPSFMSFHDFEEDLQAAQDLEKAGDLFEREHLTPFGDIVEELSWWDSFTEKPAEPARRTPAPGLGLPGFSQGESYVNPFRHIGRNDPCPCGSGKKFKKCCLAKVEAGGLPG